MKKKLCFSILIMGFLFFPLCAEIFSGEVFFVEGQKENSRFDTEKREIFIPLPYYETQNEKTGEFKLFPVRNSPLIKEFFEGIFKNGTEYTVEFSARSADLSRGEKCFLKDMNTGRTEEWSVYGGQQLPDSSFSEWHEERVTGFISIGTRECPEMPGKSVFSVWDSGNPAYAATGSKNWPTESIILNDGTVAAKLTTRKIFGIIASGNLYTGRIIRNLSLAEIIGAADGKELIHWGIPFESRPKAFRVKFKYDGLGDTCTLGVDLENRTGGTRKYIASALYKSSRDDDSKSEGTVYISEPDENGLRTLESLFFYGQPHKNANPLPSGAVYGSADEEITHINVVFASSARGDYFEGEKNATLIVKDFELIY